MFITGVNDTGELFSPGPLIRAYAVSILGIFTAVPMTLSAAVSDFGDRRYTGNRFGLGGPRSPDQRV
jgi:hypothetical protein